MKQIAVLGATGSIGTSCLDVLASLTDHMQPIALTAHRSWRALSEQARTFRPRWAVLSDEAVRPDVDLAQFPPETEVLFGPEALEQVAAAAEVDTVITGIVGAAGLNATLAAVSAGKTVGIANKETLVVAGPLVKSLAETSGATLLPVDSEHSAIFQALQAGKRSEVQRIVLTASGGPFRGWTTEKLESVTPALALDHPTWDMGPKITIDSATMMNKALEVIEARWLFDISAEQISVVVHPQSVLHSFVEFVDGSVLAQLSPPDMRLPIQYALTWPERTAGVCAPVDWTQAHTWELFPPDLDAFPALALGFEVATTGGTSGAVLNAANEVAVARFLAGSLSFSQVPRVCRAVLHAHTFDATPTLTDLQRLDAWAREETTRWQA